METIIHFFEFYGFSLVKYFLLSGLFFTFFYIIKKNKYTNKKIQSRNVSNKHIVAEIKHAVLSMGIMALLALVAFYSPLGKYSQVYLNAEQYPAWWGAVSVLLALMLHDTYFYWMHRFAHIKKVFPVVHLVHHTSTNPTPFTSYSFSFWEAILEGLALPIIIFVIPMSPVNIYAFLIIAFIINIYGHLGYEIMPKWFRKSVLFQILNTSVYHNLHHQKFKGNYSLYFRFWDRILKTEHPQYVAIYDAIQNRRFPKTTKAPKSTTIQAQQRTDVNTFQAAS